MNTNPAMVTWFTKTYFETETMLTVNEFEKRLELVITSTPVEKLAEFLKDAGVEKYNIKNETKVRQTVTSLLSNGYKELFTLGIDSPRDRITSASFQEITVWVSGGNFPAWRKSWDGFSGLKAIIQACYSIKGVSNLIPWVTPPSREPRQEIADKIYVIGAIRAQAHSIMKHAAFTHYNQDVRASIVRSLEIRFSGEELILLAQDNNADVARAASEHVMAVALSNKKRTLDYPL